MCSKSILSESCEEVQQIPIDMTLFAAGWSEWDKPYISQFWADAGLATCQPTESEVHQGREGHFEGSVCWRDCSLWVVWTHMTIRCYSR